MRRLAQHTYVDAPNNATTQSQPNVLRQDFCRYMWEVRGSWATGVRKNHQSAANGSIQYLMTRECNLLVAARFYLRYPAALHAQHNDPKSNKRTKTSLAAFECSWISSDTRIHRFVYAHNHTTCTRRGSAHMGYTSQCMAPTPMYGTCFLFRPRLFSKIYVH